MKVKINCKHNDGGAWCKCQHVKRSLFGLGARMCLVFNNKLCKFQEEFPKPKAPPPPPKPNEPPYLEETVTHVERKYNPNYGVDRICKCGHPYYRHFDWMEDNYPVGCKYCDCYNFEEE